jgi:prepilin-type N-terminal cleavage/methylation domain-containing protein
MPHRKAFTLIELLVVISVIALLISMLLPALSKARRGARNTVDLSNQRQLGTGMMSYANDYKSFLPEGDADTAGASLVWFREDMWVLLRDHYGIPPKAFGCNNLDEIPLDQRVNVIGLYQRHGSPIRDSRGVLHYFWVMGWNYFANRTQAARFNPVGSGTAYRYVRRLGDLESSSDTLLTCMIYNARTPNLGWESVGPHGRRGCGYWGLNDRRAWQNPEGLHVTLLDGSASWVQFDRLVPVGMSDYYYFKPR